MRLLILNSIIAKRGNIKVERLNVILIIFIFLKDFFLLL